MLSSKRVIGKGVRGHVNSKGKIPSIGHSEENRTTDAVSRGTEITTHYRLSYSGPLSASESEWLPLLEVMSLTVRGFKSRAAFLKITHYLFLLLTVLVLKDFTCVRRIFHESLCFFISFEHRSDPLQTTTNNRKAYLTLSRQWFRLLFAFADEEINHLKQF